MAWVAFDRAIRSVEEFGLDGLSGMTSPASLTQQETDPAIPTVGRVVSWIRAHQLQTTDSACRSKSPPSGALPARRDRSQRQRVITASWRDCTGREGEKIGKVPDSLILHFIGSAGCDPAAWGSRASPGHAQSM